MPPFVEPNYRSSWRERSLMIENVADGADDMRSPDTLEFDMDDPADYRRAVAVMADAPKPWNPRGLK